MLSWKFVVDKSLVDIESHNFFAPKNSSVPEKGIVGCRSCLFPVPKHFVGCGVVFVEVSVVNVAFVIVGVVNFVVDVVSVVVVFVVVVVAVVVVVVAVVVVVDVDGTEFVVG